MIRPRLRHRDDVTESPWLTWLGGALLVVALGFVLKAWLFSAGARHIEGQVVAVSAHNDRCRHAGSRHSHTCTRYEATVAYSDGATTRQMQVGAGSTDGLNRPTTYADLRVGVRVPLLDGGRGDVRKPGLGLWVLPLLFAFLGVVALSKASAARR